MFFSRPVQSIGRGLEKIGLRVAVQSFLDYAFYRGYLRFQRGVLSGRIRSWVKKGEISAAADVLQGLGPLIPRASIHNPVRIGGADDGGYVAPAEIFEADAVFSPGVAHSSDFELEFAQRGKPCFLADASVSGPIRHHENFRFWKKFLGAENQGEFMTMNSWLMEARVDSDNLVLQMDIEGFEWEILNAPDTSWLNRFRFLIVEFHRLDLAWSKTGLHKITGALAVLEKTHRCVNLHPNNFGISVEHAGISFPETLEAVFIRQGDESISESITNPLAANLERINNPRLKPVGLGALDPNQAAVA